MNLILIASSLIVATNCHTQPLLYGPPPPLVYPLGRIAPWMVVPGNSNSRLSTWVHEHFDTEHLNENTRLPKPGPSDYYCKDQYGNRVPCQNEPGFEATSVETSNQQSGTNGVVEVRKPATDSADTSALVPHGGMKGTKGDKSEVLKKRWFWNEQLGWMFF